MSEEFATLEDLKQAANLQTAEAEIEGIGKVKVREITSGEAMALSRICRKLDPVTKQPVLDTGRYYLARMAVSLVEPSLGNTLEEKVAQTKMLEDLAEAAYDRLLNEVSIVCTQSGLFEEALENLDDRLNDIEAILYVVAKKGGWFADMVDVPMSEVRDWVRIFATQQRIEEEQIAALQEDS